MKNLSTLLSQTNTTSELYNEEDGGGSEIYNALSNVETFAGVNSMGDANGVEDFVELYSKNRTSGQGTRMFVYRDGIGALMNTKKVWSDSSLLANLVWHSAPQARTLQ
jgi:hypothetical protein